MENKLVKQDTSLVSNTGFTDKQLDLLVEASATTGVRTKGEALMVFKKAQELGIGPANAISHMHLVNGKSGIDIHIIKAILSRPSSGVKWEAIDEYRPMYAYTDGKTVFDENELGKTIKEVPFLKDNPQVAELRAQGIIAVVKVPSKDAKGNKVYVPIDYISKYKFTRVKRNKKGELETIVTFSEFKWSEVERASLNRKKDGSIALESPWYKYPKLMLSTRAFTFGARDIASDLLLGQYETSELYDFNEVDYNVVDEVEGTVTIKQPSEE